jgi:CubicO group peptidase (beta-lactamase class C family)
MVLLGVKIFRVATGFSTRSLRHPHVIIIPPETIGYTVKMVRSSGKWIFLLSVCSVILVSCTARQPAEIWPVPEWAESAPEAQGLDSGTLADVVRQIRSEGLNIHSILLIRNGYVVLDVSFYPYNGSVPHDMASVTKSVTATLIGLAMGRGDIPDADVQANSFFPEHEQTAEKAVKDKVTVGNLMTMSSGIYCLPPPREATLWSMLSSDDWIDYVLDLPMAAEPGTVFDYCSPNYHLLSGILTRATGLSAAEFARANLFKSIGIKDFVWPADSAGINYGWGDLRLLPRDAARIGYLYLNDGRWQARRVLPEGWVNRATRPRMTTPHPGADYGYGWWLAKGDYAGVYEALGRGGQAITVWPAKKIVMVTTGGGYNRDRLTSLLIPALVSDRSLPENPADYEGLRQAVSAAIEPPPKSTAVPLSAAQRSVSGSWYRLEPNDLFLDGFGMDFKPGSDRATLTIARRGRVYTLPVGLDGLYRFSRRTPSGSPSGCRGQWEGDRHFVLDYNEVSRVNRFRFDISFDGDFLKITFQDTTGMFSGVIKGKLE